MKKPARADYPREEVADFNVRLNPEGTWIKFGKLATDGSVKVNREAERLVLFPYPRDRQFRVQLDLKALATWPMPRGPRCVRWPGKAGRISDQSIVALWTAGCRLPWGSTGRGST